MSSVIAMIVHWHCVLRRKGHIIYLEKNEFDSTHSRLPTTFKSITNDAQGLGDLIRSRMSTRQLTVEHFIQTDIRP